MPAINSSRIWLPQPTILAIPGFVASINQAGDSVMNGFCIPQTGTVTGMKFATQTVTTGCVIRGSLQTLSGAINTGTLIDANAAGTVTVANTDDNVIKTVTFAGNVSVTKGDCVAGVLDISSGTPSALQIRTSANYAPTSLPYSHKVQTGAGAFSTNIVNMCLTYDTGDVGIAGAMLYQASISPSISSSTTPDELGMKFTMPYSARTDGFVFKVATSATFQACDINLYDSSNSVVATTSLDGNAIKGTGINGWLTGFWNTEANLLKGRTYRVVLTPTTTTTWTNIIQESSGVVVFPVAGDTAPAFTSRVDAGSWTDDATIFVPIGISIDKIYQPGGSYF